MEFWVIIRKSICEIWTKKGHLPHIIFVLIFIFVPPFFNYSYYINTWKIDKKEIKCTFIEISIHTIQHYNNQQN